MSSTLLKLYNSSGDLDVMTTAEEYYCAYQAGSWIQANITTSTPGIVTTGTASGNERTVGSYVNTYFNQAVGTHPGSSISSGSTTTTLKQTNPTYSPSGVTNFRRPATWDTGNSGIKELTDAEMNTVCDRLLAYMMANEWYGPNFRVATSAPSGYTAYNSNFASDTQSSGVTAANYTLYKKTTAPTAPTTARPVCLKRASYPSGTYEGIIEMTDTQIAATFGAWILTRMVNADDTVGRYLLTTSTPAGLGYSGTWSSRGTMTDTKDTTVETAYSATYVGTYTRDSTVTYTGDFAGNYVGNVTYTGTYTRTSTVNFTRTSTRNSAGLLYNRGGTWSYGRQGTGEVYARGGGFEYSRAGAAYMRAGVVGYGHPSIGIQYARGGTSSYLRAGGTSYQRGGVVIGYESPGTNIGYSRSGHLGTYVNFVGNFAGNYTGDYAGNYLGNYVNENVTFTRTSTANFIGNYVGNYAGNYVGNYTGTTISSTNTTVNTYTLYARTA